MSQSPLDVDTQLRSLVDQLFVKYDSARFGTLNIKQLSELFNEAFERLNIKGTILNTMTEETFRKLDRNFDGKASKEETFWGLRHYLIENNLQPRFAGSQTNLTGSGSTAISGGQPYPQNLQTMQAQGQQQISPTRQNPITPQGTGQQWSQPSQTWAQSASQAGTT